MDKKGLRYLLIFIGSLILVLIGSYIALYIVYFLVRRKMGINYEDMQLMLSYLSNYYSDVLREDGLTWGNYIQTYFLNNAIKFENTKTITSMIQFVSYMPVIIFLVFFLAEELKKDFIKFKENWKKYLGIILLGTIMLFFCTIVISFIYSFFGDTGESVNEKTINLLLYSDGVWFMLGSVVFLAPLTEELIYRKLLIGVCENTFHLKASLAILISAMIFSLIHVSDLASLKYIFQYLALALPLCIAYHVSDNNIYVSMGIHLLNNLISSILSFVVITE